MTSPKPQICFLLALWGKSYISIFCDLSLRTLLAEGNIPALAAEYDCIFLVLTKPEDISFFEQQKLLPKLQKYCTIRYISIKDAIYSQNHSATLNVALERGVRSFGPTMLHTYFIFLMADYIFAANALRGLLPHIKQGVSVITAGNYQVVEEEVLEELHQRINPLTGIINIPNRELVAWSLTHLHPMTVANTVNAPQTHTTHTNRLFWRVGSDTLIGRFYLRHTLCLKPERTDYTLGGPWDYSYRSEMCPSGSSAHLMDSDEYFVIELQPLAYEGKLITFGAHTPELLAYNLSTWVTQEQLDNAHIPMVYHSQDIPPETERVLQISEDYVEKIEKAIATPPHPVSGHFHWVSCITTISANLALAPERFLADVQNLCKNLWESPVFALPFNKLHVSMDMFPPMRDEDVPPSQIVIVKLINAYVKLMGYLPFAYIWHPHYLDYRLLRHALPQPGKTLVILPPKRLHWMEWSKYPQFVVRTPLIMYRDKDILREELKDFTACIIQLPKMYDSISGKMFDCLIHTLPVGCEIHVLVKSPLLETQVLTRSHLALCYGHLLHKPGLRFISERVNNSMLRLMMDKYLSETGRFLRRHHDRPVKGALYLLQLMILYLIYFIFNVCAVIFPFLHNSKKEKINSAVLTFKVEP